MRRTHLLIVLFAAVSVAATEVYGQTFEQKFGHVIDLQNLPNYANQPIPQYITKDNTGPNQITDLGATLGRILFHDKKLSVDQTTSCASCHQQVVGFADMSLRSQGENGLTGRHSMRLINSRFARERRFFWDERAPTLEFQTTQPIQDHVEMGFSGQDGHPDINGLIERLSQYPYYRELFEAVYGDPVITEQRMQLAMAQFVRSIQSFDSRYDTGRAAAPNDGAPFQNFTPQENQGKQLFLTPPQFNAAGRVGGGFGCAGCHQPPEFDVDPNSLNNGVVGVAGGTGTDLTNTRSPSLRDLFNPVDGNLNGPLMHNGAFTTVEQMLAHYNSPPVNPQIDPRLARPGGQRINLNMTTQERDAVAAFLRTLTGTNVYSDDRWSNPFDILPPMAIDEFQVGDSGGNRSLLMEVVIVFNRDVELAADWLEITNLTTNEQVTTWRATTQTDDGRTQVFVTFDAGPSVMSRPLGNTLADGEYRLTVHGDRVVAASGGQTLGSDLVLSGVEDGMFRLYGDLDGDGDCDFTDFLKFRMSYGTAVGQASYRTDLDEDGDGDVDFRDFLSFRLNYGFSY